VTFRSKQEVSIAGLDAYLEIKTAPNRVSRVNFLS